jgi:hypothetical protein
MTNADINLSSKSITIPAYATTKVACTGSVFLCKTATAQFQLSLDNGASLDMDQGWGFRLSGGQFFRAIIFTNTSAADITVVYFAGTSELQYFPPVTIVTQVTKNAPTYTKGAGVQNLLAAATADFADAAGKRKQFICFNGDVNLDLYILDGNGTVMGIVPPRQAQTFESAGKVSVNNPNGAAIQYVVGEVFYA